MIRITSHTIALMIAAVAGIHGASAGDAVQWPTADGGNGHWYRHDIIPYPVGTQLCGLDWGIEHAAAQGAHLVTITSQGENQHVLGVLPYFNGVYSTATIGCERVGGTWQWVTGEPFDYDNFIYQIPSNTTVHLYDDASPYGPGWRGAASCFSVEQVGGVEGVSVVLEWSADCNGDGIVDYGQILDGSLGDSDSDGVPDVCNCDSDLNADGSVTVNDLLIVIAQWSTEGPLGDVDGDREVGVDDLLLVLQSWGSCD